MPLPAPVTSATRRDSANALRGLVVFALAAPEEQRAADRQEPGRDCALVPPLGASGRRRARLALHRGLADGPGCPAEDGVPLVQDSHVGEATRLGGTETC